MATITANPTTATSENTSGQTYRGPFAMLQIAANPYVTILGPERTASSRLNLAQGFNSIGTTIGPLIGGYLIFKYFAKTGAHGAESVKMPYLAFCIIFLVLAVVFYFI